MIKERKPNNVLRYKRENKGWSQERLQEAMTNLKAVWACWLREKRVRELLNVLR